MYASLFHQFLEPGLDLLVQPQLLDRIAAAAAGLRFPERALGLGEQHGFIAHQIGNRDFSCWNKVEVLDTLTTIIGVLTTHLPWDLKKIRLKLCEYM